MYYVDCDVAKVLRAVHSIVYNINLILCSIFLLYLDMHNDDIAKCVQLIQLKFKTSLLRILCPWLIYI